MAAIFLKKQSSNCFYHIDYCHFVWLIFYLQNATENDIKNSIIEQQRLRQIESTKAISQNIGLNLDSVMARLQMLASSVNLQQGQ